MTRWHLCAWRHIHILLDLFIQDVWHIPFQLIGLDFTMWLLHGGSSVCIILSSFIDSYDSLRLGAEEVGTSGETKPEVGTSGDCEHLVNEGTECFESKSQSSKAKWYITTVNGIVSIILVSVWRSAQL